MKRLMIIIATVLMVVQGRAWLVEYETETKEAIASSALFTAKNVSKTGSWYEAASFFTFNSGEINIWNSNMPIYRVKGKSVSPNSVAVKPTGFVVGKDNSDGFYLIITCGKYSAVPIKRLELDYVLIDDNEDAKPAMVSKTGKTTYTTVNKGDGAKWGRLVYEPYFPVTSVMVTYFTKITATNKSDLAQSWSNGLAGCVITNITVEHAKAYSAVGGVSEAVRNEFKNLEDEKYYLKDVIQMKDEDMAAMGTKVTNNNRADVDENGDVNSADVVKVYNAIQTGVTNEYNGHAYVDLGLPSGTKWATCNLGAYVPEGRGDFYAYCDFRGYAEGKKDFTEDSYEEGTDPIHYDWEGWALPTDDDYRELIANTESQVEYVNGIRCAVYKSKINRAKLIFPMYGYIGANGWSDEDNGYYWTSTESTHEAGGMQMVFMRGFNTVISRAAKHLGHNIRYVCKPE